MLKREFKINFKNWFIWTLICIAIFTVVFIVYPSIMSNENSEMLNQMLKVFPEEVIKMFNMDINGIDTVYGWFKTEGYVFLSLIFGLYSAILGSNILLKEESEKTIEFLYSKPISRNQIVWLKIICGIIYILLMIIVVTIFNLVGMAISNNLELKQFLTISLAPILTCLPIFFITMFISTFFSKTRKTLGIGMGLVFISYFLQMISGIGDKVEFLKYFSLFTLSASRNIVLNNSINYTCIAVALGIILLMGTCIFVKYNKKELV